MIGQPKIRFHVLTIIDQDSLAYYTKMAWNFPGHRIWISNVNSCFMTSKTTNIQLDPGLLILFAQKCAAFGGVFWLPVTRLLRSMKRGVNTIRYIYGVSMHLFHLRITHRWWWFLANLCNSKWALILAAMLPEQFDHFLRRLIGMRTPKVSWPIACMKGDKNETHAGNQAILKSTSGIPRW